MEDLKVFKDDCDWVVARSEPEARVEWGKFAGDEYPCDEPMDEMAPDDTLNVWVIEDDGKLRVAAHGEDGASPRQFTATELCSTFGVGWLCSSEY